uniref:Interleukin 17a/f1 n=1 Tax=Gasterosteus aculeatus aculeatus TaxID=481459 RepID=A0AAQ4RZ18_GASAC|nr:interleukin-17F-like [Gasterosteus aculeatus aculeatus]
MSTTANCSRVTAVCVMTMMMMMMATEAMPKAGGQSRHRKLETVPLQLDPGAVAPPTHTRALQNASLSPWTYNVSRDDALFPPLLSEARCLLRGCLDPEGREDLSLESRPILHQTLVLRRVKAEGAGHSYHYRLESRLLAVGCTCVRPVIRHQE